MTSDEAGSGGRRNCHRGVRNGKTLVEELLTSVREAGSILRARKSLFADGIIVRDPEIPGGSPVLRGTRVPFQSPLDYVQAGQTLDEFLDDFPTVTREMAVEALEAVKALLVRPVD